MCDEIDARTGGPMNRGKRLILYTLFRHLYCHPSLTRGSYVYSYVLITPGFLIFIMFRGRSAYGEYMIED